MHVKTIVLDGFKSYGQRTVITDFDSQFNAITGLNGSGKSNILDAICFVLGITNLSQVRAGSLQDLIYKSGQANINKATVSITFDNTNPDQCPPMMENVKEITITRQVIIGGKNKYMINGTTVPNKKVQDLFCSVQLNVNNPHFLIMQGRITKVLNMKPVEILSMIEEAAGTKMYEVKRQAAQKTIDKKEAKLKELNTILIEEISPKLEKLRKERTAYLEYKTISRNLEDMLLLYQAWQYFAAQRAAIVSEKALDEGQNKIKEIEMNIENNKKMIKNIEQEVDDFSKKGQTTESKHLRELESKLKEHEKEEATANAEIKAAKDNITGKEKAKKQLEKQLKDDENALKSKQNELNKVKGHFEKLKQSDIEDTQALEAAQKRYEALSSGMELNDEGEAETLQQQLMAVKERITTAKTEKKQSEMQLEHSTSTLKEKEKKLGVHSGEYEKDKSSLTTLEKEISILEKSLGKINYSAEEMGELKQQRQMLDREIVSVKEQVEEFEARRPYTQFHYRDPEPNFDRRRVNGVVCRLFKVKNNIYNTAIETAAGGRLYNVVIDSDETGKKLLQHGNLQQRTTFIPLNKIQAGRIGENVVKFAQDLVGKENVQSALDLLEYDKKLLVVMKYVFGNVLICKDISIARQVAFHQRIRCRCVTLDGDVADPAGVLSGGAREKGASILQQLSEIRQCEAVLTPKLNQIRQIDERIKALSGYENQYMDMKQKLELKQHEVQLVTQRLQNTAHHRQQEEINNLKLQIGELKEKIKNCTTIEHESTSKLKDLEAKAKNSKGHLEKQLKDAEQEMRKLKQKADNSRKEWGKREQEYESLNLEIQDLEKSVKTIQEQIQLAIEAIEQAKIEYDKTIEDSQGIKEVVQTIQNDVKKVKTAINEQNKEIQQRLKTKEELTANIYELELQIKQQNYEIKKLKDDYKNLKTKEDDYGKRLQKDQRYVAEAEKLTPAQGRELEKQISRSKQSVDKLSRTVNAKAQNMFDQEEAQYNELKKKQRLVEHDRNKLLKVISDLDKKKQETLKLAHDQISKDFGSIFSILLPGANSKLCPPPGKSILDGLEVKVSLGGVWKDSLTELSGGQRSLAALSLILAMLLFKPAPLYILDEVDAALDLSHTQNIGHMLKTHFKKSQFIVVSLKDGMFNNANVLFRTKFVDGVSTVTRTANKRGD